jgi:hypothetical protein
MVALGRLHYQPAWQIITLTVHHAIAAIYIRSEIATDDGCVGCPTENADI